MAKSDYIVSLVGAAVAGDRAKARSVAEALIADERAKNHHSVAERLQRVLSTVSTSTPQGSPLMPVRQNSRSGEIDGRDIVAEIQPIVQLDSLFLPEPVLESANQLIEEHLRAGVLRAHGYDPRHKVLLCGPPGNGKTSFAEAIAEALALPLYVVRYDALIGSYLGETNVRLRHLFDYIRSRPCVFFFDEFDAISKERGDIHESGEIKRVVSFLLMQFDMLPSYVIAIAATNHAELLDKAVWRRFQMRLNFPAPPLEQIEKFISRLIAAWRGSPKMSPMAIAKAINVNNYAEALDFCQAVRRRHILGLGDISIDTALKTEINLWQSRATPGGFSSDECVSIPSSSARTAKTDSKTKVSGRAKRGGTEI